MTTSHAMEWCTRGAPRPARLIELGSPLKGAREGAVSIFEARKRRRPPRGAPGGLRCAIALGTACLGLGLHGPNRRYVLIRRLRGGARVRRDKATGLAKAERRHRVRRITSHVHHAFALSASLLNRQVTIRRCYEAAIVLDPLPAPPPSPWPCSPHVHVARSHPRRPHSAARRVSIAGRTPGPLSGACERARP